MSKIKIRKSPLPISEGGTGKNTAANAIENLGVGATDTPTFAGINLGDENLNNYELGSITERQVVSYSALENMTNKYYSNYEGLKADLKVPFVFDFSIVSIVLNLNG